MKRLIVFLLLLSTVSLFTTSCKEDDESPADLLIGSWKFSTYVRTECEDPADNESETCTVDCEVITFTTDKVTYGDGDTDPYTISGNQITLGTGSKPETFEFSISGSTLILTSKRLPADGGCKEVTTLIRV